MKVFNHIVNKMKETHSEIEIGKPILIQREDGTSFQLNSYLTGRGKQVTGKFCLGDKVKEIPKFRYFEQGNQHSDSLGTDLYMDINPKILKSDYYKKCVGNFLLSTQRVEMIKNDYNQYAGGFYYNKEGKVIGIQLTEDTVNSFQDILEKNEKISWIKKGIHKIERIGTINQKIKKKKI